MSRLGRATLYMGGLTIMFVLLVIVGALGFVEGKKAQLAIGILFVISTLVNMTTTGPVCYPIVAETPSGRLRYKTITLGRFIYNCTGIVSNILTPRMVNPKSTGGEFCPRLVGKIAKIQLGDGEPRPPCFMPAQTCSVTFGAGSDFPKPKIGRSGRLTCSLRTVYLHESSNTQRSTVSPLKHLLRKKADDVEFIMQDDSHSFHVEKQA